MIQEKATRTLLRETLKVIYFFCFQQHKMINNFGLLNQLFDDGKITNECSGQNLQYQLDKN